MKKLIIALLVTMASCASEDTVETESAGAKSALVVPETVRNNPIGWIDTVKYWCSATLIAGDRIVTSGHCVDETVATSSTFHTNDGRTSAATLIHKDMTYDIAFYRTTETFTDFIPLDTSTETASYEGEEVTFSGWGCAWKAGNTDTKRTGTLTIFSQDHGNGHYIRGTAGFVGCPGDSGGAIISVKRNVVIGVLSGFFFIEGAGRSGMDFTNVNVLVINKGDIQ